jgi:hypothetical protein
MLKVENPDLPLQLPHRPVAPHAFELIERTLKVVIEIDELLQMAV